MNFIKKFFESDPNVLPPHLRGKLHDDWPFWPLTRIPRSFMTTGPRAEKGSKFYAEWPPRLVEGFDVTKWEWCDKEGNRREIYVKAFEKVKITAEVYKRTWDCLDVTNPGVPMLLTVDLNDGWGPACIPHKTSEKGYLRTEPKFYCQWDQRPGLKKYYFRWGHRPDYVDMYYNPFPYLGRNTE